MIHVEWCILRCDYPPPHTRVLSAMLVRYHREMKEKRRETPSAILSQKSIARCGGGGLSRTVRGVAVKVANGGVVVVVVVGRQLQLRASQEIMRQLCLDFFSYSR